MHPVVTANYYWVAVLIKLKSLLVLDSADWQHIFYILWCSAIQQITVSISGVAPKCHNVNAEHEI